MLKLHAIGGYGQFGRNMTAIQYKQDILILDCGIKLQRTLHTTNKIIPDLSYLKELQGIVKGVVISHAHLDHCGALKEFTRIYKVPIYCSKYTAALVNKLGLYPKCIELGKEEVEIGSFIVNSTMIQHSIPEALLIKVKINSKIIIYASDFKIDYTPVIGQPTNLNKIASFCEKPDVLIVDTTRAIQKQRTKSQRYVVGLLEDLIGYYTNNYRNIFITTFASNIARIKTILELANQYQYEVVFMGSAFQGYIYAAKLCKIISHAKIVKNIQNYFDNMHADKKYIFIVTGSQGQKDSFLYKLIRNRFVYKQIQKDLIIFSSSCIPEPLTFIQREDLLLRFKAKNIKVIDNVHTSGHAGLEDHLSFMKAIQPKTIVPTHSDFGTCGYYVAQAKKHEFMLSRDILVLQNKQSIDIN